MSEEKLLPPLGFRQRGPVPTGTRVLMIRHGESRANAEGVAGGPLGDGGLTEKGQAQARALAERLVRSRELHAATAFYCSDLPRARQTAEIVAAGLPSDLELVEEAGIAEISVGEGDGLTWSEFVERYGAVDWDEDPTALNAPGGESLAGFHQRSVSALEALIARHPGELIVLVTHGGFIEQALKYLWGVPAGERLMPRIENCSMTEIEFAPERQRLLRYNDLAPLAAS